MEQGGVEQVIGEHDALMVERGDAGGQGRGGALKPVTLLNASCDLRCIILGGAVFEGGVFVQFEQIVVHLEDDGRAIGAKLVKDMRDLVGEGQSLQDRDICAVEEVFNVVIVQRIKDFIVHPLALVEMGDGAGDAIEGAWATAAQGVNGEGAGRYFVHGGLGSLLNEFKSSGWVEG